MTLPTDSIVILGAGIIGLDVAYILAQRGLGSRITVIAEYLPGDTAETYTSPWAGCNFSALSGSDAKALHWDRLGYAHLTRLATERPQEAWVERTPSIEYWQETVPRDKIKHMSSYLEDFRVIPEEELPHNAKFGISFTSLKLHAPKHCEFLYRHLKEHCGVRFMRQRLPSVQAAYLSENTDIVFNCTGLAARALSGVEDAKVYPTRGQIVLARAPAVTRNMMLHGKDFETYIIPRPQSNGNVILGGYMQKGVHDTSTYFNETESILERTKALSAELRDNQFEILAVFSGLRPSREGGARIEREPVTVNGRQKILVHNYGAGGTGFQAGFGMSLDAVNTVDAELRRLTPGLKAKL